MNKYIFLINLEIDRIILINSLDFRELLDRFNSPNELRTFLINKFNLKSLAIHKRVVTLLFLPFFIAIQEKVDPYGSYESIEESFWNAYSEDEDAEEFANIYLKKAKIHKDSIAIARGFNFLARINPPEINLKYTDSIILYTSESSHENYPALGYSLKGYWLYELARYREALDAYLKAYESAKEKNNAEQQNEIAQVIGALKNRWGDYKEALEIYKEHLTFLNDQPNFRTKYREDYLITLHNIILAYQRDKQFTKALDLIGLGLDESVKETDSLFYYDFIHSKGVNELLEGSTSSAKRILKESLIGLEDPATISMTYYYLGTLENELKKQDLALIYFKKVDSIYEKIEEEFPELRTTYEFLVNYYRYKDIPAEELKYTRKLIAVDSILSNNKEYLNTSIIKEYDTPELLQKKEELIRKLNSKNNLSRITLIALTCILLIAIGFGIYFFRRNQIQKKKFDNLIRTRKEIKMTSENNSLTEEVTLDILEKLEQFEKNQLYLENGITLFNLSKSLETNSTYLSRVINETKNKNFSNYINDLRINHILERLDTEPQLKNYKIQALGEEVGFNKADAFSKAFEKVTGIKPSFYLKNLRSSE